LIPSISASELAAKLSAAERAAPLVIDVREPWETRLCVIPSSVLIPLGELVQRIDELDRSREIVCVCHHGMRSLQAGIFLSRNGFENVINLSGGIEMWAQQVDPAMPRY
jgi:rhodanese-related sulfurtransferase